MQEIITLVEKNAEKIKVKQYYSVILDGSKGYVYIIPTKKGTIIFDVVKDEGNIHHKKTSLTIKRGLNRKKIYKYSPPSLNFSQPEQEMRTFWIKLEKICNNAVYENQKHKDEKKIVTETKKLNSLLEV